ncbi:MAG: hypothetical protein QOE03_3310 [Micromonosporaceae bacterium]|jgi:DNA-binding HxlR family transcriptional regulator|nr:hypothetical protein [Micromonosporaceae bacterium]
MPAEFNDRITALMSLVSQPHVVEVLDTVDAGPLNVVDVVTRTRLSRRRAAGVLRALAADGIVTRCGTTGSWDDRDDPNTMYTLTTAGRATMRELYTLDVWNEMYARRQGDAVPPDGEPQP